MEPSKVHNPNPLKFQKNEPNCCKFIIKIRQEINKNPRKLDQFIIGQMDMLITTAKTLFKIELLKGLIRTVENRQMFNLVKSN